jgi:ABC-2 type transport system permease protein
MDAVLVPAITALIGWKVGSVIPGGDAAVVHALPLLGLAVYTHLVVQPFWLNAFGWERGGARVAFLAPVDLAEVLRVKNEVLLAFSGVLFAVSAAILLVPGGRPPPWAVLGAVVLFVAMAPWLYAAGNLVSILQPRAAPFTLRGGNLSALSALSGIVVVSAVTGVFALPVLAAIRWEAPGGMVGAWVGMGAAGVALHRATLPALARLLAERRDVLLPVACGDDA